jgi:hypothetical protein
MKFELSFVEEGAIKLDLASSQSNIKVRTHEGVSGMEPIDGQIFPPNYVFLLCTLMLR